MKSVAGGWTSHKMRSDDYEAKKRAALAHSAPNSYTQGIQSPQPQDLGDVIASTRTVYGNANLQPNRLIQNRASNFEQSDSPGNSPIDTPSSQTGSVRTQISSTTTPHEDPETMDTDALSHRLALMAKGGQGFPGLNNRNRQV